MSSQQHDGEQRPRRGRRGGGTLHNRLAVLRAERDVSRAQLAEAVGVNPQTIGFLERGDYGPTLELALRICEYFRLPVEAVFSLHEFPPMSAQLYPAPSSTPSGLPSRGSAGPSRQE